MRILAALAIAVILAAGCARSGQGGATCSAAPAAELAAITTGLVGGTRLGRSAMIVDPERANVRLIAAEIDGPGVEGPGQVGVWATNGSLIYAAEGYAEQFSSWGRLPDASVSEWTAAARCLG